MINKIMNQRYSTHNQRYSSHNQIPSRLSPRAPRQSHAAAQLLQKESQIDLVKKRISALCVREQRYNNRTVNTDTEIERRDAVQRESLRIQQLLDKQRQK